MPRPPWVRPSTDGVLRAPTPPPPPGTGLPHDGRGEARWGLPSALIGLGVFLGLQLVVSLIVALGWYLTGHHGAPPTLLTGLISLLLAYVGVYGYQYGVARVRGAGMRADYALSWRWYDLLTGIGGGFVVLLLIALGTLVVADIFGVHVSSTAGTAVLDNLNAGPVLYAFLFIIAFVGPFVEELHFRGMWWHALARRYGPVLTVAATAGLFAVAHLEPVRLLGLFLGGAGLGVLRLLSRRLGPSVVAHMTVNTISALSLLFASFGVSPMP